MTEPPVRNWVCLYGVCGTDFTAAEVAQAIEEAEGDTGPMPLAIRLNSPGGVVSEAVAIAEIIKARPDTVVSLEGATAGAALPIAFAADSIIAGPGSWLGLVEPIALAYGRASRVAAQAATLEAETRQVASAVVAYSDRRTPGQVRHTVEGVLATMKTGAWYAQSEIAAQGFADRLVKDDTIPGAEPCLFAWTAYGERTPIFLQDIQVQAGLVGIPSFLLGGAAVSALPNQRATLRSGPAIARAQRTGTTIIRG
ncbi:MAG: ATP-dependent Clp protease proteolytic subunit [Alsobacter sp.]